MEAAGRTGGVVPTARMGRGTVTTVTEMADGVDMAADHRLAADRRRRACMVKDLEVNKLAVTRVRGCMRFTSHPK